MAYEKLFTWLLCCSVVQSFPVYDCSKPRTLGIYKLETISTCDTLLDSHTVKEEKTGTLLQMPTYYRRKAYSLSTLALKQHIYCTYFRNVIKSITTQNYIDFTPIKLTRTQARSAVSDKVISLGAAQRNLVPGFDQTLIDSADIDEKGFCKSYSTTIEVWVYRIRLSEVEMDVEVGVDGRTLSVNVFGERVLEKSTKGDGYLRDGTFISWDPETLRRCPWEKIYSGVYDEYKTSINKTLAVFTDLGITVQVAGKKRVCGVLVSESSDSQIFISLEEHPVDFETNPLQYGSWTTLILSASQFVETKNNLLLNNISSTISFNQCILEQKIQRDIVFGAKTEPEMVAYRLSGKKGFVINIAGITLQVQRCDIVEARLRAEEKCNLDIPVTILASNKTSYMDPVTHVMRETTSQLPCDDTQNPYFQIRNQWYRLTPSLQIIPDPPPLPSDLRKVIEAQPTVIKGLYPEELTRRMDSGWYFSNRRRNAHNRILNMIDPTIGHEESSAGGYHHLLREEGSNKNLFGLISISVWNIINSVGILVLFVLFYRRGRGNISINTQVITTNDDGETETPLTYSV